MSRKPAPVPTPEPVPAYPHAWSQYAHAVRMNLPPEEVAEFRARLNTASIGRSITKLVDKAPPLTDGQIDTLAAHLREVGKARRQAS